MTINHNRALGTWLFNPFVYVAGVKSLFLGMMLMGLCAGIGFINNVHFDGVLDMHLGASAGFYVFLLEVLIDWVCISIVLFILGLVLSKSKIRWIDVFGTQALARYPLVPAAALMAFMPDVRSMDLSNLQNVNSLVIPSLGLLIFVIWFVALMFNAYKISCNLKDSKLVVSFIGGLISAEIVSKILISQIVFGMLLLPSKAESSTLPVKQKEDNIEIAKDILNALNEGKYELASVAFDDNMRAAVPIDKLESVWVGITSKYGEFQNSSDISTSRIGNSERVTILCHFERGNFDLKTTINSQREVIGLLISPQVVKTKTIDLKEEDLKKYLGVYSSPTFPLKVTITNSGNQLIGQATGQVSFELECYDTDKFKNDPSALKLELSPNENKMVLLQGGGRFELQKE